MGLCLREAVWIKIVSGGYREIKELIISFGVNLELYTCLYRIFPFALTQYQTVNVILVVDAWYTITGEI